MRLFGDKRESRGVKELLYLRVAAAAAVSLSLAGCSFFGFGGEPEAPKLGDHSTTSPASPASPVASPGAGLQLAALPGYQSDRELQPAGIDANPGFVGVPSRRPEPAVAAVPARPIKRKLDLTDYLPQRRVLDLKPVPAAQTTRSHSLAELVADQAWRKRTARQLERLFQ